MDRKLRNRLAWPDARLSLSDEDFLEATLQKNQKFLQDLADHKFWTDFEDGSLAFGLQAGEDDAESWWDAIRARAEILFYFLAQVGRRRPGLFPVPDLGLSAFNILAARHKLLESRLICLDLALLPVAVLAAAWGARVALPPASHEKSWPKALFLSPLADPPLTDDRNMEEALVLGRDPLKLTESYPGFLEELAKAKGGIIFCFWDFLGVNLHNYARMKWLKQGLIRSLIQLPRPGRQGAAYYPALIEIGPGGPSAPEAPQPLIRLVDVREQTSNLGDLSQGEVLEAVLGPADQEKSLDVAPDQLAYQEDEDFTPRRFLAGPRGVGEVALKDCARVLRCQIPRTKSDPDEKDGSFICREINLSQLDELTGFVKPGAGQPVGFKSFNPVGKEEKFLLRRHDILMCFRGTEATIGRVGLVVTEPEEPLINGQSLCLIRVFDGDPVWLYYYFRRPEIRRRVLSRSSGSNMLTVNLGDLNDLAIARPGPTQSAVIQEKHLGLLNIMEEIWRLFDRAGAKMKDLGE